MHACRVLWMWGEVGFQTSEVKWSKSGRKGDWSRPWAGDDR